jgi:hypothetical protein
MCLLAGTDTTYTARTACRRTSAEAATDLFINSYCYVNVYTLQMARAATSNNSSSEEETARIAAARALMLDAVYYSDGQNMRFFGRNTITASSSTSSSDSNSVLFDRGDMPPVMLTCPAKKIQVRVHLL